MQTRHNHAVVLYITCICMCVAQVASYMMNHGSSSPSCNYRLRVDQYQKSGSGGRASHHLVFQTPAVVSRVDVDLSHCHSGSYSVANIQMEYIDGSDIMGTKRKHSVSMNVDRNNNAYYIFDPTIYAREVFFSTDADIYCASMNLGGCAPMYIMRACLHGGVSVRDDLCACPKGYYGDRCGDSINEMPFDEFTYLHQEQVQGWVFANDGDFEYHGEVRLRVSTKGYPDNALEMRGNGGHIHLRQTHPDKIQSVNHYRSRSRHSVFSGTRAFTSNTNILVGSHHDDSHEIYFYNTHKNNDIDYPGASLVYRNHELQMDVHTGSRTYSLSVAWYPNHYIQQVTSSFSPQYGCSIYVDGEHMGSVSDSSPARYNANLDDLCIGSCKYCYQNCRHYQIPCAEYWMGALYAAGASLPQLVLNNKLSCIGMSSLGGGGSNYSVPQLTPTIPTPPPPTTQPPPPTTTTTTTTTTPAPPPSTTTTTTVPTATGTKAVPTTPPTTTMPTTPAPTPTAALTTVVPIPTTTVQRPTGTQPFSATRSTATTASQPGSGLLCYSCTKAGTDGACNSLTTCSAGQVCAAYHDPSGYTHTCLDKQVCSTAKSLVQSNCWKCCDYSLCNKQCAPAVQCNDSSNCAILVATGYKVCSDPRVAKDECPKTCNLC